MWYLVFRQDGSLAWVAPGRNPNPPASDNFTVIQSDTYDRTQIYSCVNGAIVVTAPDPMIAARATAVAGAAGYYQRLLAAGLTWSGTLYQIDPDAQAQIAAMGIMALGSITDPAGSPWPAGFYWIAADNSHAAMDAPTMYAFGRAVAAYVSACVLRLRAIKDTIAAAADQTAIAAIDVTAGYPAASA